MRAKGGDSELRNGGGHADGGFSQPLIPWSRGSDLPPSGTTESWAVDLLKAYPTYQSSVGRKRRIWLGIPRPRAQRTHRGLLTFWLRPVVVLGALALLVGGTAIASAALGHWPAWSNWPAWMRRSPERVVPPATSIAASRPRVAPVPEVAIGTKRVSATVRPSPQAASDFVGGGGARRSSSSTSSTAHARPLAAPVASSPIAEDTTPVLAAMRALRRDHNPARARVLLGRYLDDHPEGSLAEEALAMSIEAAVAHHDSDAAELASRYLRRYPSGPFRALAEQAIAKPTD